MQAPSAASPNESASEKSGKEQKETCDSPVPGRPFRPEPQPTDAQSIFEQNRMLLNWTLSNTGKSGGPGADPFDGLFRK